MINKLIYTSESVGRGHPDKICDQISDAVLDECLKQDPMSRVACEVFASNRLIVIGGEITTKGYVDVVKVAWDVLKKIGYSESDFTITSNINSQSSDISAMVSKEDESLGAGDQGMAFGYACNETKQYLPLTIVLSHELLKRLESLIKSGELPYCKYDMKSQISLHYDNNRPVIDSVVVSVQHDQNVDLEQLRKDIKRLVIVPILEQYGLNTDCTYYINKNGQFIIGGPVGDTGLTGRKIIVDTYGSIAHHGGGAFSGKDPTKVDRTGAYFARYIAKNIVAAGLADQVEIQLSFCIGEPKPLSMYIDCFGTNKVDINKINKAVETSFNFDLYNIIKKLNLRTPIYSKTSVFGHFGKDDLPWEQTDMVDVLKEKVNE